MHSPMPRPLEKLDSIYVVVADHCTARFLTAAVPEAPLVEHAVLQNPGLHLRESELVSDHAGRVSSSTRRGGHSVGHDDPAREHLSERFAKAICEELKKLRVDGRCERIHLVAERDFLGLLRSHLDRPTAELVASELGKDVIKLSPDELRRMLPAHL